MSKSKKHTIDDVAKLAKMLNFVGHNNITNTYFLSDEYVIHFKTKFDVKSDKISFMKMGGEMASYLLIDDAIKNINHVFSKELRQLKINKLLDG